MRCYTSKNSFKYTHEFFCEYVANKPKHLRILLVLNSKQFNALSLSQSLETYKNIQLFSIPYWSEIKVKETWMDAYGVNEILDIFLKFIDNTDYLHNANNVNKLHQIHCEQNHL